MAISLGSINTGLPKDIVKRIMDAERIPIGKMQDRKSRIGQKQILVKKLTEMMQSLKKSVGEQNSARSFLELKSKTNEDFVSVAIDRNKAEEGNYRLEVVKLAQKSSALSSGFGDPEKSYTGVGYIQYELPNGRKRELYVDVDDASLKGVARLINKDRENGMRANVVNDGSGSNNPWRLLISFDNTGADFKAEFPFFYFIDGDRDFYIERQRKAENAVVKIDGFKIEIPENRIKDVIPGVTIDLKKAKKGEEFGVQISKDRQAISLKVEGLVDNINKILAFIVEQNRLNEKSDTSKTLGGDIILQSIESRLRDAIMKDVNTSFGYRRASDLGINFQRNGEIRLDRQKFDGVLANNYAMASEIVAGQFDAKKGKIKGFVDNIGDVVDSSLKSPDGLLISRDQSIQSQINQIDKRIEDRQRMIDQKERILKDKFARLEGTISKIKSQQAGLASLKTLPAGKPGM